MNKKDELVFGLQNYFNDINKNAMLIENNFEHFLNLEHPDANSFIQNITGLQLSLNDVIEVKITSQGIYFKLKQSVEYIDIELTLD